METARNILLLKRIYLPVKKQHTNLKMKKWWCIATLAFVLSVLSLYAYKAWASPDTEKEPWYIGLAKTVLGEEQASLWGQDIRATIQRKMGFEIPKSSQNMMENFNYSWIFNLYQWFAYIVENLVFCVVLFVMCIVLFVKCRWNKTKTKKARRTQIAVRDMDNANKLKKKCFKYFILAVILVWIASACIEIVRQYLYHKAKKWPSVLKGPPIECTPERMGILQTFTSWVSSLITWSRDPCVEYYEAVLVDPMWEINLLSCIFLTPWLSALAHGVSRCSEFVPAIIHNLLSSIPIWAIFPIGVFLLLVLAICRGYSFHFFYGLIRIQSGSHIPPCFEHNGNTIRASGDHTSNSNTSNDVRRRKPITDEIGTIRKRVYNSIANTPSTRDRRTISQPVRTNTSNTAGRFRHSNSEQQITSGFGSMSRFGSKILL